MFGICSHESQNVTIQRYTHRAPHRNFYLSKQSILEQLFTKADPPTV
jgi:hypothetical protein